MNTYKSKVPEGKSGAYAVERFEVPKFSIGGLRAAMDGRPITPGKYTRLVVGEGFMQDMVMSDTPAEISDLDPLLRAVAGFWNVIQTSFLCSIPTLKGRSVI
jgi:hypothetical protein